MSRYNKGIIGLIVLLTIIFLAMNITYRDKEINKLQVELDDKKEVVYRLQQEKEELETRLNNYTIEERKIN